MIKVAVIFGTRPEAIKMTPVIKELMGNPDSFHTTVWVTAQHRELLDQVLALFEIKPDYDLGIMKAGQDEFDVTSSVLSKLKSAFLKEKPDLVLVHGDTTTAMAASIAAFYMKTRIGHVEAGLRTHDKYHPFPEEMNRKIVGALADLHFAPTPAAKRNLLLEGVMESDIHVTGNTAVDALFLALDKLGISTGKTPYPRVEKKVLVTTHRRESFGVGLENICLALKELARLNPSIEFVFPAHPNPNVRKPVKSILGDIENIKLIEPLDYLPFVKLMSESYMILTDSGGVQEEAPSLGKPVLLMREVTERPEAVEAGTVAVVGTDKSAIIEMAMRLLTDKELYRNMSMSHNPYGDGKAAQRIVTIIKELSIN